MLTNTEFKGECHTCEKNGHKQNKCPEKNKIQEEKRNGKFISKCNHCCKVGHKDASCWELKANLDTRIGEKTEEKEE